MFKTKYYIKKYGVGGNPDENLDRVQSARASCILLKFFFWSNTSEVIMLEFCLGALE